MTIVALDLIFRSTGERAIRDVLEIQLIALLAEAEPDTVGSISMPRDLPEPRFSNPGSGLYGEIVDRSGFLVWRSASAIGTSILSTGALAPGERRFVRQELADGEHVFALSLGVSWEFADDQIRDYVFSVAESLASYHAQVAKFRRQLLGWFTTLMMALLLAQAVLLRWVLRPLHRAERQVREVEAGRRMELGDDYPTELHGLTGNMNALIRSERARLAKYRDTLANLAHSLKTPLAVMRSVAEDSGMEPRGRGSLDEQIDRIDQAVAHHLRRAATSGGSSLGVTPVNIATAVRDAATALDKVYAEKSPACELVSTEEAVFHGDAGDLTELVGNLLDNAYKWCRRHMRVAIERIVEPNCARDGFRLVIEDDGPGISQANRDRVLERGTRLDQGTAGHGIGLAVVQEIVSQHAGSLQIEDSSLGGARFVVTIPPR